MCVNVGGTKVHVLLVRAASMALGDRRRRAAQDMTTGNGCVTGEASPQCGKYSDANGTDVRQHATRRVPQGRAGAHRPKQTEGAAGYVSCWRMSEQREVQSYDASVVVVAVR